ncbi:MAG TPA: hypothetical protein VM864_13175 [Pyrinomonadaceae bacterium]|jgi:hypothetical protein|nr:hypothetical protein [Pyrinomonadaceae bacterium]
MANDSEPTSEHPLADETTWNAILEPALCRDADAVDVLARLLFTIKNAIDAGQEGATRASQTLQSGIELIYLHTNAHKAALKLYLLTLEGNLHPQDEPLHLINAAIERASSHTH